MRPMAPMQPMEWANEPWWPDDLGPPSSSGEQNSIRYAFFPRARRLLIQENGATTTYNSGDHQISGVSQQNSGGSRSVTFTTQSGQVKLEELQKLG